MALLGKTYTRIDVGDADQVAVAETKAQIAREREVHELGEILDTYGGRALVWRVLAQCGLQRAIPADTNDAFRDIGKKDIGQWLLNEVFTSARDVYTLMRQEAQERDEDG